MDRRQNEQPGESERAYLGIDGTMGDAQDVDHPFIAHIEGYCAVCGLAKSYNRHNGPNPGDG